MTSKPTTTASKCPGYCCSYPLIEVSTRRHRAAWRSTSSLDYETAEERFTLYDKEEKGARPAQAARTSISAPSAASSTARTRRCTVYAARPRSLPRLSLQQELRLLPVPANSNVNCRTTRSFVAMTR